MKQNSKNNNDDNHNTSNMSPNATHPAVKRILRELKEIQECDNPDIIATALEDNIFEWLFIIRGASGTDFEGGLYHGRIIMPAEYPFKPPAFVMSTPSGRFETKTKICLSISSYHPESWQPSWSVQSALVALIAFMQTPGQGAIGSLDCSPETRRQLALESQTYIPRVQNNPEKQALINEMHATMLARVQRDGGSSSGAADHVAEGGGEEAGGGGRREQEQQEEEEETAQVQEHGNNNSDNIITKTTSGSSSKNNMLLLLILLLSACVWMFLAKQMQKHRNNEAKNIHGMNLVEYSVEL